MGGRERRWGVRQRRQRQRMVMVPFGGRSSSQARAPWPCLRLGQAGFWQRICSRIICLGMGRFPSVAAVGAPRLVGGSEDSVGGVEVAEAAEIGRKGRCERWRDDCGRWRGCGGGRVLAGGAGEFALEGGVF